MDLALAAGRRFAVATGATDGACFPCGFKRPGRLKEFDMGHLLSVGCVHFFLDPPKPECVV